MLIIILNEKFKLTL